MPVSNSIAKPKRPFVKIISWIVFLQGIYITYSGLVVVISSPILLVFPHGSYLLLFFLIATSIINGPLVIALSFGLRAMRKWALYTFTVLTVLSILSFIVTIITGTVGVGGVISVINVGIIIYLLPISKKFV